MNQTCPRCNALIEPNSRFCTNCGTNVGPARSASAQVPPWATGNAGANQQQQQQVWGGQGASPLDSLGFASQNNSLGNNPVVRQVLTILLATLLGTLVLLFVVGILAVYIPGLRCVFLFIIAIIILVPWIIYVNIRRYIRRTIGRLWWIL